MRVVATDYKGGIAVSDISFLVHKIGDTNRSAPCCRYNAEVISSNSGTKPAGILHRSQWTGKISEGELYKEALYNYGIYTDPWPLHRHHWLTCKGMHAGSRTSDITWHTSINKFSGTNTRFILMPTTGDSYQHPWLPYQEAQPDDNSNTGCTREGTRVLMEEGLSQEINSQLYLKWSFGRFSMFYDPDIMFEGPDPGGMSDGGPAAMDQHPDCEQCGGKPPFFRHYLFYEEMNPGSGMSGVGGGKMSQIAGCDYAVGWMNGILTAHEMGHAFDLAHAEMWTETSSDKKIMKDPAAKSGSSYTEYQDYWAVMGNGVDMEEYDKLRMGWLVEHEYIQYLDEDRETVGEYTYTLYPIDRPESKGMLMMLLFEEGVTADGTTQEHVSIGCQYRQWPGAPGGESAKKGRDGAWGRDSGAWKDRRYVKSGLSCNRNTGAGRGLSRTDWRIDFNIIDGDIESTLPSSAGSDPAGNSNVGLGTGKTWYHPDGQFSISVLNMGWSACDAATMYPLYDEWGHAAYECLAVKLKTGLPDKPVMGRTVSLDYEFIGDTAYLCDGVKCAAAGKVGCGAVAVKAAIRVSLTVEGEADLQPEAIAWKDGLTYRTFDAGSLSTEIPIEEGRSVLMVASYDDATQARLEVEVTSQTQTAVTFQLTSTLYHGGNSEKEVTDLGTVELPIEGATLDLGNARGVDLIADGDYVDMADGFEAEGLPIGGCGAFTVTLKVDLSSFGSSDAVFAMYDGGQIAVPYLLTTIASGRGGRTVKVCWLDGQECQTKEVDDRPEGVTEEHFAWIVEQTSTGTSLRMFLNGVELSDPVGALPMIIDVWCIISEDVYPSGRATPSPPPAACDHEPLGSGIIMETLRFGAAAADGYGAPSAPIVHARAYNYALSKTQLAIDEACEPDDCANQLGVGSLTDVPPTFDKLERQLEFEEAPPTNGLLEVSAQSDVVLLYNLTGPDATADFTYDFSNNDQGSLHSGSATGAGGGSFTARFEQAGAQAIKVAMEATATGATGTDYVIAHVYKQGANAIHMGRVIAARGTETDIDLDPSIEFEDYDSEFTLSVGVVLDEAAMADDGVCTLMSSPDGDSLEIKLDMHDSTYSVRGPGGWAENIPFTKQTFANKVTFQVSRRASTILVTVNGAPATSHDSFTGLGWTNSGASAAVRVGILAGQYPVTTDSCGATTSFARMYNYYMGADALVLEAKCPERGSCKQFCVCSYEDSDPVCRDYYPASIKATDLNNPPPPPMPPSPPSPPSPPPKPPPPPSSPPHPPPPPPSPPQPPPPPLLPPPPPLPPPSPPPPPPPSPPMVPAPIYESVRSYMLACDAPAIMSLAEDGTIKPFTIEAWIKADTPAAEGDADVIMAGQIDHDDVAQGWWFGIEYGAPVFKYAIPDWAGYKDDYGEVGGYDIQDTSTYGTWMHVAVTVGYTPPTGGRRKLSVSKDATTKAAGAEKTPDAAMAPDAAKDAAPNRRQMPTTIMVNGRPWGGGGGGGGSAEEEEEEEDEPPPPAPMPPPPPSVYAIVYKNGEEVASGEVAVGGEGWPDLTRVTAFGRTDDWGDLADGLDGALEELRVFSAQISPEGIYENYLAAAPPNDPDLDSLEMLYDFWFQGWDPVVRRRDGWSIPDQTGKTQGCSVSSEVKTYFSEWEYTCQSMGYWQRYDIDADGRGWCTTWPQCMPDCYDEDNPPFIVYDESTDARLQGGRDPDDPTSADYSAFGAGASPQPPPPPSSPPLPPSPPPANCGPDDYPDVPSRADADAACEACNSIVADYNNWDYTCENGGTGFVDSDAESIAPASSPSSSGGTPAPSTPAPSTPSPSTNPSSGGMPGMGGMGGNSPYPSQNTGGYNPSGGRSASSPGGSSGSSGNSMMDMMMGGWGRRRRLSEATRGGDQDAWPKKWARKDSKQLARRIRQLKQSPTMTPEERLATEPRPRPTHRVGRHTGTSRASERRRLSESSNYTYSVPPPWNKSETLESVLPALMDCGGGFPQAAPMTFEAYVKVNSWGVQNPLIILSGAAADHPDAAEAHATGDLKAAASYGMVWHFSMRGAAPLFGYVGADYEAHEVEAPEADLMGTWQHVAVSIDGSEVKLYQNGVEVAREPFHGPLPSTKRVLLGGYGMFLWPGKVYAFGMFEGTIDEVRVFDVARTSTQINETVRYSGSGRLMDGLVRNYNIRSDYVSFTDTLTDTTGKSAGCALSAEAIELGQETVWVAGTGQHMDLTWAPPSPPMPPPPSPPPPPPQPSPPPTPVISPSPPPPLPPFPPCPPPGLDSTAVATCAGVPYYATGTWWQATYETMRFDGHTAAACQPTTITPDSGDAATALTLSFHAKPRKGFTGPLLSLVEADGTSALLSVSIGTGGWIKATVHSAVEGQALTATLRPRTVIDGKTWLPCALVLSTTELAMHCAKSSTMIYFDSPISFGSTATLLLGSLPPAAGVDVAANPLGPSGGGGFKGSLDEVRLWNRKLSVAQIGVYRSTELVGDESGLVGYWRMGEEVTVAAADGAVTIMDATARGAACSLHVGNATAGGDATLTAPAHGGRSRRIGVPESAPVLLLSGLARETSAIAAKLAALYDSAVPPPPPPSTGALPTARSCQELLAAGGASGTGVHTIALNGSATRVYCDQARHGGGWTLLLSNAGSGGFDAANLLSRFKGNPSVTADYSILGLADHVTALGAAGAAWSYMLEVDVVTPAATTLGGVYTAPASASLLDASASHALRSQVTLQTSLGEWSPSILGLQHVLPRRVLPADAQEGVTALLTVASRPGANVWGALVNGGEDGPDGCRSSTAILDSCTRGVRLWVREAVADGAAAATAAASASEDGAEEAAAASASASASCDLVACAAAAQSIPGGDEQCKQPSCSASGDGSCEFVANRPDGAACDDGDDATLLDECDAGECRGWTLVGKQAAPIASADVASALGASGAVTDGASTAVAYDNATGVVTLAGGGTFLFDVEFARRVVSSHGAVELAMRWPGTLFSTQVWSQTNAPHARGRRDGTAAGFTPKRVSLIGFDGLVGSGGGDDDDATTATTIATCPTLAIEVGGTEPYIGGLAGPGLLPVHALELYARAPRTTTDDEGAFLIGALVGLAGLAVLSVAAHCYLKRRRRQKLLAEGHAVEDDEPPHEMLKKGITSWFARSFGHFAHDEHKKQNNEGHHAHKRHSVTRIMAAHGLHGHHIHMPHGHGHKNGNGKNGNGKIAPKGGNGTRELAAVNVQVLKEGDAPDHVADATLSARADDEPLAEESSVRRRKSHTDKSGHANTHGGLIRRMSHRKSIHASQLRWAQVRTAFRHREGPFDVIAPNPNTLAMQKMLEMARSFMGEDGKIDRSRFKRLDKLNRKELIKQGKLKRTCAEAAADELFLIGTYVFDTLSPHRGHMGKFAPILAVFGMLMMGMTFSYMSGQHAQYVAELRYRDCEQQAAIAQASALEMANAQAAVTQQAVAAAALASSVARAANNSVSNALVRGARQAVASAHASATRAGYEAATAAAAKRQSEIGPELMQLTHSLNRANDQIQLLESMVEGEDYAGPTYVAHAGVSSYQAAADRRRARALSEGSPLSATEQQQLLDAYAARDAARATSLALYEESAQYQVAQADAEQAMLMGDVAAKAQSKGRRKRVEVAGREASSLDGQASQVAAQAAAQLAAARAAQAALYNTYDPYAALRTLGEDTASLDAHSVQVLQRKVDNLLPANSSGFGSSEHACTLFQPESAMRSDWNRQINNWMDEMEDEFLVRWGARYSPKIVGSSADPDDDDDGDSSRWVTSAFVHASWGTLFVALVSLATVGVFCEKRYGSIRFASVFLLSAIGGNFFGALGDDKCEVFVGAAPACLGLCAFYWVDVAAEAIEKLEHHVPHPMELILAAVATLLQIVIASVADGASHATNLGGLITGVVVSILFLPKFLVEDLEAAAPFCAIVACFVIFVCLPVAYYEEVGEPICVFHNDI